MTKRVGTNLELFQPPPALLDQFEQFWLAYPRKCSKGEARRAFLKARKDVSFEEIMKGLRNFQFDHRPKFVPYPASWLNQERWLDVINQTDPFLRAVGLAEFDG